MKHRFIGIVYIASLGLAQDGPYNVAKTAKVGGLGCFDCIFADEVARRLYIPRGTDFDLDTLVLGGEIPNTRANGAVVDAKTGHGFSRTKPVSMWDS